MSESLLIQECADHLFQRDRVSIKETTAGQVLTVNSSDHKTNSTIYSVPYNSPVERLLIFH